MAAAALLSLVAAPALALAADRMSARAEQRLRSGVLRRRCRRPGRPGRAARQRRRPPRSWPPSPGDRTATRGLPALGLGGRARPGTHGAACGTAALASAVLAAPLVLAGAVEPAPLAVVVLLQLALVEPYAAITTAVRQYPALRAVLRRISAAGVLERGTDARSRGHGVRRLWCPWRAARRGAGDRIVDLAAAWPGGDTVFAGLNASAGPGRWLAVTGPSGSGKSTLLAVAPGLPAGPQRPVRLSGRAAWCPQEAHLFDSTIRGNLMLGLPPRRTAGG